MNHACFYKKLCDDDFYSNAITTMVSTLAGNASFLYVDQSSSAPLPRFVVYAAIINGPMYSWNHNGSHTSIDHHGKCINGSLYWGLVILRHNHCFNRFSCAGWSNNHFITWMKYIAKSRARLLQTHLSPPFCLTVTSRIEFVAQLLSIPLMEKIAFTHNAFCPIITISYITNIKKIHGGHNCQQMPFRAS